MGKIVPIVCILILALHISHVLCFTRSSFAIISVGKITTFTKIELITSLPHGELVNDFLSMEHWYLLRVIEEEVCEDVENMGVTHTYTFMG